MIRLAAIKVVLEAGYPALTPGERWSAARRFDSDLTAEGWMIVMCVVALVVLVGLLCWTSVRRVKKKERKTGNMSCEDMARQRGLSERESQLLGIVGDRAGLKRPESVFTMGAAFGIGALKVIEEGVEGAVTGEEKEQLRAEIGVLREKLGFGRRQSDSGRSAGRLKKLTTRDIPVGKKLYVTRRKARAAADIESTVVANSDTELAVTLSQAVKITFGEAWCVRYYSGASVWEFDTSVLSFDGDTLVLQHSDRVRFVNRRRFLRVPVRLDAFVAQFPFTRRPGQVRADGGPGAAGGESCSPPEFVRAVVTELAGPGLRIELPLEVKVDERVLVVFNLNDDRGEDLSRAGSGDGASSAKMVEDIGEVRHSKGIDNGYSIAVELTGLSDADVDKLVQATNAASLKTGEGSRGSAGEQEPAAEALAAQGV